MHIRARSGSTVILCFSITAVFDRLLYCLFCILFQTPTLDFPTVAVFWSTVPYHSYYVTVTLHRFMLQYILLLHTLAVPVVRS